ncbi:TPA: S8 family serine peptidase [Mannheimia haemolytica]|uniref:S8 family peptidase n=1 Tax=Mannheimia haemolytica TaxID=75985 RepID=UPI000358667A|nr:S8 family serine peptidase [Mannheimia haemolytica]AGQ39642.1 peptidase S8 [Mannheimia haemolytica D171]MDW0545670.1 S8 family serine peptidase [Mannheimia haemolytica]TRC17694.1 autotransporter domain-containing protein [Mannheimia haemolytica]HDL1296181.1 S8 family serine peptidase [Mannheimia haemolytica]HDL1741796.1 S8 family serine peptidase [Mannheimia haemolytica]
MYKIKHSFNKTLIAISISSFLSIAYATESIKNPQPIIQLSESLSSKYSGKGVKLGVMDEGFMVKHPRHSSHLHPLIHQLTTPEGEVRIYDASYPQFEVNPVEKEDGIDLIPSLETHGAGVAGIIAAQADKTLGDGYSGGIAKGAELYVATKSYKRTLEKVIQDAKKELENAKDEEDEKTPSLDQMAKNDLLASKEKEMAIERAEWASGLNKLLDNNVFAINNSWNPFSISDDINVVDKFYQSIKQNKHNPLLQAIMRAKNSNTLLVFAAGNESKKQPGVMALLPRYFPELEKNLISAVAVDKEQKIAPYSNHCGASKNWCVAAPGDLHVLIGVADEHKKPQYGLTKEQGTSFSAPAITASLAVLKERFDYLTATQIRDTLLTTATDLGEKGVDNVYGWGLINLKKAVNGPTQFLNDETITVTRDDHWSNPLASQFKITKKGDKSLHLDGENHLDTVAVEEGRLALNGKTKVKTISNHANLAVNGTEVEQNYSSSGQSQLEVLGKSGLIANAQANIHLAGSLKIDDKLTEKTEAGDVSATIVQLKDKATYQGGFTQLVENENLAKRGLIQDLYFKESEIIAKVNKPLTDEKADTNGQAGLALLNALRTTPIAYRRSWYNGWLQSALEQRKLDNLHYAVSNNIYADSLELLRSQNAKGLTQAQQHLFTAYHTPLQTTVWAEHLNQKQSASSKHTDVKHHQSQLGVNHKLADKTVLSATLSQQKNRLEKPFAQATLKQTALNIGLRYHLDNAWFSEATLQFARQKYQQSRRFASHQLGTAETRGSTLGGEMRIGYQFMPNQWIIEPSLGVQWIQTKMNGLNESGELATQTAAMRYRDVNIVPSVKLQRTFQLEQGSISPYIGLNYLHRLNVKITKITSNIAGKTLHSEATTKRNRQLNGEVGVKLHYKNWFTAMNLDYSRVKSANLFGWKVNVGFSF